MKLPLGQSAYNRAFGQGPEIVLRNRFFERAPTNLADGVSLLARPGSTFFKSVGIGPIRATYYERGAFDNDLFVVSNNQLFRVTAADGTVIPITGTIQLDGSPEMTIVTGPGYEHLFIADGQTLQYYDNTSFADAVLTLTPDTPPDLDTQTVSIDGVYYQFAADPTTGTPDGSMGDPYLVDVGSDDEESLANLRAAINATGTPGTTYSEEITTPHATVQATASDTTTLTVQCLFRGTAGNAIVVTITGDHLAWDNGTLTGGGNDVLFGVPTPDDVGIVSVATLASYVLAVAAQSRRWYYIEPGEVTIDPLNFYEAEQFPDDIQNVRTVGDTAYFFKDRHSETWGPTGIAEDPFQREGGLAFSRGAISGTPVVVNETVLLVSDDGVVRDAARGLKRISNHGIEERIRLALKAERENAA